MSFLKEFTMILSCSNISKSFGEKHILKQVSFHLEDHEKAAIVGINGAGKSTLLKIIIGELACDEGCVALSKGASTRLPGPAPGPGQREHHPRRPAGGQAHHPSDGRTYPLPGTGYEKRVRRRFRKHAGGIQPPDPPV